MIDYEAYRHGSARWATAAELKRAGLLGAEPTLGYFGNVPLGLRSDAPKISVGGSGAGKFRDLLVAMAIGAFLAEHIDHHYFGDSKGEIAGTLAWALIRFGIYGYFLNPMGLHGLPNHACNPLDMLKPDSPTLRADCKLFAEALLTLSGASDGQYFEVVGRRIDAILLEVAVRAFGYVDLPTLYEMLQALSTGGSDWESLRRSMMEMGGDIAATAAEIEDKRTGAPREWSAVMATILNELSFMAIPQVQASTQGGGSERFSLAAVASAEPKIAIFDMIPVEFSELLAPLQRLNITALTLYKQRAPASGRLHITIDEAGNLKRFNLLRKLYTLGRGLSCQVHAIYQSTSQLVENFGAAGAQTILGSSQVRQFFGIRDYETAELVSKMLGRTTLSYANRTYRAEQRRQGAQALYKLLHGGDPFEAAFAAAHHGEQAGALEQQPRALLTPDEVLALPADRQILFISGIDVPPILAERRPYWCAPRLAGLYFPNPFHPPADRVRVATRFGSRWRRVVTEDVPFHLTDFPQHDAGYRKIIKGYRYEPPK